MKVLNVDRIKDIPKDYDGIMAVPITILTMYNPEQFELIDIARDIAKGMFKRILIRKRGNHDEQIA